MNDQQAIWDSRYKAGTISSEKPTAIAREAESRLALGSSVVELGCGAGNDAAFFARQGHSVIAIDHSPTAIEACRGLHPAGDRLSFEVHDIAQSFLFADSAFDLVYARLSLHYFPAEVTARIFAEIQRLLKPGGLFAFMCKSTADPLYGLGRPIEPDVFERGHVRHFFSEDYARRCLGEAFAIDSLVSKRGKLYGSPSAWIEVIATRLP